MDGDNNQERNIMKYLKYLLVLCVLLVSCATIEYEGFKYTRVGNQELIDVTINMEKHPDGSMFLESHLGRQFSEREIAEMIPMIIQALKNDGIL